MSTAVDVRVEPAVAALPRQQALADARTVLPGMVPFGLMLGVTVVTTGTDPVAEILGGAAIYGGSAQLTAITLLDHGLGALAVALAAAVVNARLLLYGAAMGRRFREQPRWFRWCAPHFIIDQTYLMATDRPHLAGPDFRRYWGWLGGAVLVVWTSSIGLGIAVGPAMPPLPHLALVGAALFLGMLMPRLAQRPALVAARVGGAVAAAVSLVLPAAGIISGAVAGVACALAVDGGDRS